MLLYISIIVIVLIVAVAARFAEGEPPDNGIVHTSTDDPGSSDEDQDDVALTAHRAA